MGKKHILEQRARKNENFSSPFYLSVQRHSSSMLRTQAQDMLQLNAGCQHVSILQEQSHQSQQNCSGGQTSVDDTLSPCMLLKQAVILALMHPYARLCSVLSWGIPSLKTAVNPFLTCISQKASEGAGTKPGQETRDGRCDCAWEAGHKPPWVGSGCVSK